MNDFEDDSMNLGYEMSKFPVGRLPRGENNQALADSGAFTTGQNASNPMRGVFTDQVATPSMVDTFANNDLVVQSTMLKQAKNNASENALLGKQILDEFRAGTSTLNSLQNAAGPYSNDAYMFDTPKGGDYAGVQYGSIVDQYVAAGSKKDIDDLPIMPFMRTYPNFGNAQGVPDTRVDVNELASKEAQMLAALHKSVPVDDFSGIKKDLMPIFSTENLVALENRPLLQSMGKRKGTRYLGGVAELPDDVAIDPRYALLAESNIPSNIPQTAGELNAALQIIGYRGNDSFSRNPFGEKLKSVKTLGGSAPYMNPDLYMPITSDSREPLSFSDNDVMGYIYGK